MPNETIKDKTSLLKILPYITAGALACLFIVRNSGFFSYAFEQGTIRHIWVGTLLANIMVTPALLGVFLTAIWGLGERALFLLKAAEAAGEYKAVFSFVFGIGILNLLLAGLGASGILTPFVIKILIAALFFDALFQAVKEYKNKKANFVTPQLPEHAARAFTILICYILSCGVVAALSPPASWDSLSYHLPIARQYLAAQRIFLIPCLVQHQCSIGMEMLTTAALAFNNDALAQLLPLVSFAVTLRVIFIFVKNRVSRAAGCAAAALFASLPVSLYLMGKVTNDYHLAMFSTAALVSLIEFSKSGQKGLLYFALFFTGFAVNAKLTGLITALLVMLLIVYWILIKIINIKSIIFPLALFALISSMTLARNFIFTGNPVFPVFYQYLGGRGMSQANYEKQRMNNIETTSLKPNIANFLLLPYHLIKDSERFQNQPRYFAVMFILLLILRLVSNVKPQGDEMLLLYFTAGFVIVWFFSGSHIWRYMLAALPAAVMLIVIWWAKINRTILKIVAGATIALNFTPAMELSVNNNLFAVFALPSKINPQLSPRLNYLSKTLDNYDACNFVNKNSRKDSKILLFREFRSYYLERAYMIGDPLMQNEIRYEELKDSNELAVELKRLGVTHILVNFNFYPPCPFYYDRHINELMQKFTADKCALTYSSKGIELYTIKR